MAAGRLHAAMDVIEQNWGGGGLNIISCTTAVRLRALKGGKLVYTAAPKLAAAKPFYMLGPHDLPVPAAETAERSVAARIAPAVDLGEMRPVDLIVMGSVAQIAAVPVLARRAGTTWA